jgi:two-component system sensor histidine kinase RpfC
VSHELRTPLTGIVAAAELLAAESTDRNVTRRTETILALAENLLTEINDLLDQAKYEAGRLVVQKATCNLTQQLQPLCATFESMAIKKGLVFRARIDPAIVDAVETDIHLLRRVLLNLVGNAVKFTERGEVTLLVDLVECADDTYRLRFSVSDTGIGIPDDFKSKLFQPFAQVDQGPGRRYGGTGLGLALTKKIVEALGSELRCESTLGVGSRFWFETSVARVKPVLSAPITKAATIVPPKRILVAEDNQTNLVLLQELLRIDHHDVTACTSGMAALELLAKHDFDLLLLDYNLGDMDGVHVLNTYRFGRLAPAPAIFLTADATPQTAGMLKAAGAAAILHKPVSLTSLRQGLARVFLAEQDAAAAPTTECADGTSKAERPALRVVPIDPLDHEIIEELKSVNPQPGFLATLLVHAENDISRSCGLLLEALADRSYAAIPNVAHALKGVSANVGAVRLAKLAHGLMNLSSEEIDASRDRLAADLREWSKATIQALREVVTKTTTSTNNTSTLHLD